MTNGTEGIRGASAFIGAATDGIGEAPGFSGQELAIRASLKAMQDAGVKASDIDGVFGALSAESMCGVAISEYLGIQPKYSNNNKIGGSTFLSLTHTAAMAIKNGLIETALIYYGSNQRSAFGRLAVSATHQSDYEGLYKPRFPMTSYALAASRHMYEYGTTREQLAQVAVAARQWAQLNPDAFMRDPLTIEDVMASRVISDPFSVRDCCLVTDGAGALIMTSAERAKDFRQKPVYLLGAAGEHWHKQISAMPDLTVTAASKSGPRALEMARLKPSDVDVIELYDAFTINTILFLEDLGFCPKGEGGRFVTDGHIAPGGGLPVNTNGGGLSCVHPGMYGIFTLIEGVQQLQGECNGRQIENAKVALCHGSGGVLSSQVTNILGTEETL